MNFKSSKFVSIKNSFKSGLLFRILFEGYYLTILFNYLDTLYLAPEIPGSDSLYFKKQLSQIRTDLIKKASFTFNYSNIWTVKCGYSFNIRGGMCECISLRWPSHYKKDLGLIISILFTRGCWFTS